MRQLEREAGCLIFDDTIQEKAWTDENEIMCWHYDHSKGRVIKGINLPNALVSHWRSIGTGRLGSDSQADPVLRCDAPTAQASQHGDKK